MASPRCLLTALLLACWSWSGAAEVRCYACSYTWAGNDGLLNRECVTSPANHTLTFLLPCRPPRLCVIKAVYDPEYARLLSLDRNCMDRNTEQEGCLDNALRPSCVERCAEDLCNGQDGDIHRRLFPSPSSSMRLLPTVAFTTLGAAVAVAVKAFVIV